MFLVWCVFQKTKTNLRSLVIFSSKIKWLSLNCSMMMMTTMSIGWDYVSTAVTNGSIVYPSGNIWAWRAMVERCRQRKTRDSSIRALWQSYQQSSVTKQDEELKEVMNLELWSIFSYLQIIFVNAVKSYDMGPPAYFPSEWRRAADIYRL
jgi:hypothetical protein